jgi:hypothetical protein
MWQPYVDVIREKCPRRQTIRSRIEPMKKIARSLRKHRELILNYFRAQKEFSSGVIEGSEQQSQSHHEEVLRIPDFSCPPNLRSIRHLASCPSRN